VRVVLQIGYQKAVGYRKEGQRVQAWINDEECSWQDDCGKYLTSRKESAGGKLWYLWATDVEQQDVIRISVKTAIAKVGPDEARTFESLYYVSEEVPVREINVKGVGRRGYPLLKGRLVEMGTVSEQDKREAEIEEFLKKDGF
jgi:hypothetical protein